MYVITVVTNTAMSLNFFCLMLQFVFNIEMLVKIISNFVVTVNCEPILKGTDDGVLPQSR
jgi:hypothetical protein